MRPLEYGPSRRLSNATGSRVVISSHTCVDHVHTANHALMSLEFSSANFDMNYVQDDEMDVVTTKRSHEAGWGTYSSQSLPRLACGDNMVHTVASTAVMKQWVPVLIPPTYLAHPSCVQPHHTSFDEYMYMMSACTHECVRACKMRIAPTRPW